jgi:uncharacterized membrane protein YdjX (TVP38/TMEM64 family)
MRAVSAIETGERRRRLSIPALRTGAVVALVAALGWSARDALHGANLAARLDGVRALGATGAAGLALAFVVAGLLAVPTPPLSVAAGWLYGPLLGTALASPAGALGALAAFGVGRTVARALVLALAARHPRLEGALGAVRERGLGVVLSLRLSPLMPFSVMNFVFGATAVRPRDFALGTLVGSLPLTAAWVALGAVLARLGRAASVEEVAGSAGFLAAALVGTVLAVVAARRALDRGGPR